MGAGSAPSTCEVRKPQIKGFSFVGEDGFISTRRKDTDSQKGYLNQSAVGDFSKGLVTARKEVEADM